MSMAWQAQLPQVEPPGLFSHVTYFTLRSLAGTENTNWGTAHTKFELPLSVVPPKPSPFLSLPLELRHAIYAHIFPGPSNPSVFNAVALRLTCRTILAEVDDELARHTSLTIPHAGPYTFSWPISSVCSPVCVTLPLSALPALEFYDGGQRSQPNSLNSHICRVLSTLPELRQEWQISFENDNAMGKAATWHYIHMVREGVLSYMASTGRTVQGVEMMWGGLVPSESGRRFMVQGEHLCLPLHYERGVEGKDYWGVEREERSAGKEEGWKGMRWGKKVVKRAFDDPEGKASREKHERRIWDWWFGLGRT